jgi:hypothetical protein
MKRRFGLKRNMTGKGDLANPHKLSCHVNSSSTKGCKYTWIYQDRLPSKSPFLAKASVIPLKIVWGHIRESSLSTVSHISVLFSIIRASLGLPPYADDYLHYPALEGRASRLDTPVLNSVILDAEMVCYSESKGDIDGKYRLHSLLPETDPFFFLQSFGEYAALLKARLAVFEVLGITSIVRFEVRSPRARIVQSAGLT